jgi:predicted ATPase
MDGDFRLPLIACCGGPGVGKTTVIAALHQRGYGRTSDSARALIQERLQKGLSPRPSPREFAEQLLDREKAQYRSKADATQPVFFDRSVLDPLGMLHQLGVVSDKALRRLLTEYVYFPKAFIFPPWEEIYTTDAERDHTFEHVVAVHAGVTAWYRRCGYDLVEVPRGTVADRCDFILQHVA